MAKLFASYRMTAQGYDATNTRLIDESGLGNHLPLLSGTPDFTGSYSSKTAFKMHGSAYFGGANLLNPEAWTAIMVVHPKVLAGETLNMVWSSGRYYPLTEHGHVTPSLPFEDGTSSTAQLTAHRIRMTDSVALVGHDYDSASTSTGLTLDAWNVLTAVWNGESSQVRARWGTSAWMTDAITQHYQVGMMEEMRIGYRPTALTTASNHLGVLRIDIYSGDFTTDDPTAYAARVAALTTTPDL